MLARLSRAHRTIALATLLGITVSGRVVGQQTDVIRGRVVAADSTPLQNATVTAVDTVAKLPKQVRADAKGAFSRSRRRGRAIDACTGPGSVKATM